MKVSTRIICLGLISGLLILVYITPMLIIHFEYYLPAKQWNHNVMTTPGYVIAHFAHRFVTHYLCNCVKQCTSYKHHCTTKCDVCERYCYRGTIDIGYNVDTSSNDNQTNSTDFHYIVSMQPYETCYSDKNAIEGILDSKYPIYSNMTIFYNQNDPAQYRFTVTPTYAAAEICGVCVPIGVLLLNIMFFMLYIFLRK